MLRFLATVFGCVHDLEQTALMRERQRDEWKGRAIDRLGEILALKGDLTTTRKARDEQTSLNHDAVATIGRLSADLEQANHGIGRLKELHETASVRAVAAESEAAYYRGLVGNVRRAMQHDHQANADARVHPEQRAAIQAQRPPRDDEAKAQYDAAARATLR